MMIMVICMIIAMLFLLGLFSKRRFGILGLALASGALLSSTLAKDTSIFIANLEIPTGNIPYLTVAKMLLIILPPFLLLLSGPAYSNRKKSILGAACFALLGTLLLLGPISEIVPYDDSARSLLNTVAPYSNISLAALIGVAIIDTWLTHATAGLKRPNKSQK